MTSTEQFFSLLTSFQYLSVAAQSLLVHDYLLTFPLEVVHIWHSPWSTVKVVFLLSRYGNLIGQSAYTLEILGVLSRGSSKFCTCFTGFIAFYGVFQSEGVRILVLLRAWAIWGCKRYVAILLISAYAVYLSMVTVMLIYATVLRGGRDVPFVYLAKTGVCVQQSFSNTESDLYSWIMPSVSLLLDSIVFFMVALSLRKLFKETQCLQHSQSLLPTLAMDAALYLVASTVASVMGIVSQTIFINDILTDLMLVCSPLVVVAGQRVVLNLRSMQSLPLSQQAFDLNLVTDSSLLSPSAEDSRVPDGDPLAQSDLDRGNPGTASGIEMLNMPANRV